MLLTAYEFGIAYISPFRFASSFSCFVAGFLFVRYWIRRRTHWYGRTVIWNVISPSVNVETHRVHSRYDSASARLNLVKNSNIAARACIDLAIVFINDSVFGTWNRKYF